MKPVNIALIGMPGCGKTSIGKEAAFICGLAFLDTDAMIEERYGKIPELFKNGEAYFREIETQVIRQAASAQNAVISTGGGSILKEENMAALKEFGMVVYINRPLEKILSDIDDTERPLIKGKSHRLIELYKDRKALYEKYADFTVLNGQTHEKAVQDLIGYIKENLEKMEF